MDTIDKYLTESKKNSRSKYIVHPNGSQKDIPCKNKKEVWKAIESIGWGGYTVSSPIGLDVSEFIPF